MLTPAAGSRALFARAKLSVLSDWLVIEDWSGGDIYVARSVSKAGAEMTSCSSAERARSHFGQFRPCLRNAGVGG